MMIPKVRGAMVVLAAVLAVSCAQPAPKPPVAKKVPHSIEVHGEARVDEYYWLRERSDPKVLAYLEAENDYTDAMLAGTAALQDELFRELKNRVQPTDSTVPALSRGYYYFERFDEGLEYPIYCRRKGSPDAPDEVIL
ncbi:MAG TPA: hypothetical protein VLT81_05055, partial [Chondromyces sp.]|nr:hypothetical protein [Chondromyces sp.]